MNIRWAAIFVGYNASWELPIPALTLYFMTDIIFINFATLLLDIFEWFWELILKLFVI